MEYLFSLLLFSLNLFDYEVNLNRIMFFAVSVILFSAMVIFIHKKTQDFLCTCLTAMCHVWPISWVTVFGDPSYINAFQVTWFYLIGAVVMLYGIVNINKLKTSKVNALIIGAYVSLGLLSLYPLIISPSVKEGLKEFIIIGFFMLLTFIAFLNPSSFDSQKRRIVENAYIFVIVVSSVLLILQTFFYFTTGYALFKFSGGQYYDSEMISAKLLMEDTSCSTIMLGSGVFYMLDRINKKDKPLLYIVYIAVTMIGLAVTSRRTSIIALIFCIILYIPIVYKGIAKKLTMFTVMTGCILLMLVYLFVVRPIDDVSQLLDFNGRIENYLESLYLFVKHPLGVGYDNVNLLQQMEGNSNFIIHNTVLRWLNMGGILFVALVLMILGYMLVNSYKKRNIKDFWVLVYCFIAMNFIPDLLSARFFVIPCMLVFLSQADNPKSLGSRENNNMLDHRLKTTKSAGRN